MQEKLIDFETAKLAKEKGFDNESNIYYNETGELLNDIYFSSLQPTKLCKYFDVPTQSLLQKWLREVHNIEVETNRIRYSNSKEYVFDVRSNNVQLKSPLTKTFNTYEEALEMGLQEALKLIEIVKEK